MVLNNKYLKRKKGVKDIIVNILGEQYAVNPKMLPIIAARVYKDNKIYAFIILNKRGGVQIARPSDVLGLLQVIKFANASSIDDLQKSKDIPSCMIDSNGNYVPLKIKESSILGSHSTAYVKSETGKKTDVTVNNDVEKAGSRQARNFQYSGAEDTGMNLGYQKGFSMEAEVPDELFPIVESQYHNVLKECGGRCNVKLTVLERKIDEKTGKATTVRFLIEGEIADPEWRVVAIMYYNEEKTVVKPMVFMPQALINKLYTLPCKCDICGERRSRNKTYYLQSLKDNRKFIQAAGHCMNKTFGVKELAAALEFEKLLQLLRPDELNKYRGESINYYNTLDLFAAIYKSKAYETTEKDDFVYRSGLYENLGSEDKVVVDSCIKWIKELDSDVHTFHNVQVLLESMTVHKRFVPDFKRIWKKYINYIKDRKSNLPNLVESFTEYRDALVSRVENYDSTLSSAIENNEKLDKKYGEKLAGMIEEAKADNARLKTKYDSEMAVYEKELAAAEDEYNRKLSAYTEYKEKCDGLSEVELIQLENDIVKKYGLEGASSMRTFSKPTWINVRVKSVYLKLIRDNQFGEGKAGPYVFKTDEGFYISWYTTLKNGEELGLPTELGVTLELNKVLRCKTKQMYYGELQVTYCKFVDNEKVDSLVVHSDLFKSKPEMKYIRQPRKPNYSREDLKLSDAMGWTGRFEYKDIERLKLIHMVDMLVYNQVKSIDAEKLYYRDYISIKEKFRMFVRSFKKDADNKAECIGKQSFKLKSVRLIDLKKSNYTLVFETDRGYLIHQTSGGVHDMTYLHAYFSEGVKLEIDGVEIKEIDVKEAKVNDLEETAFVTMGYFNTYLGDKCLKADKLGE